MKRFVQASYAVAVLILVFSVPSSPRASMFVTCQTGTASAIPPAATTLDQLSVISPQNANRVIQVRQIGRGPIAQTVLSPDRSRLALATSLGIWLYASQESSDTARLLSGHVGAVTSVAFSADGLTLVSGGQDCTARVWDVSTGKLVRTLQGHTDVVTQVAFSPDGKTIGTGSADQTARLWTADTGKQLQMLDSEVRGVAGGIRSIAFSPDSQWFAYSSSSGGGDYAPRSAIQFWNLQQQKFVDVIALDSTALMMYGAEKISFSPDGKKFAYLSSQPVIIEFPSGRPVNTQLSSTPLSIRDYEWSPTSNALITVTMQGDPNYEASTTLQRYDIAKDTYATLLEDETAAVTLLGAGDDDLIVLIGQNVAVSVVERWTLANAQAIKDKTLFTLPDHNYATTVLDISPDAHYIALGGYENRDVIVREVDSGKEFIRLSGHDIDARSLAFSPDGNQIVSTDFSGVIRLFELSTGKMLWSTSTDDTIWAVTFSPDGTLIASASGDYREGGVTLWDAKTGKQIALLTSETASAVAFSPDGLTVAAGIEGDSTTAASLHIWDLATTQETQTIPAPSGRILGLAFSPDGKFLATANANFSTQLWDLETGKPDTVVASIGGYNTRAGITFSPDGKILATTYDSEVVLWDMATRQELARLTLHTARVEQITFSGDGKLLVSGGDDYAVRFWGIP